MAEEDKTQDTHLFTKNSYKNTNNNNSWWWLSPVVIGAVVVVVVILPRSAKDVIHFVTLGPTNY